MCSQRSEEILLRIVRFASGRRPFLRSLMFNRTLIVFWKKTSQIAMTIIEIMTARLNSSKVCEAPGVEPLLSVLD
jgi:hypothetical protein